MDKKFMAEKTVNIFNTEKFKFGDAYYIAEDYVGNDPVIHIGLLGEARENKLTFWCFDRLKSEPEPLVIDIDRADRFEITPMRAGETGFTDPEANLIYMALVKLEQAILKGKGNYDGYYDTFNSIYKKLKEHNNIVEEPDDGD